MIWKMVINDVLSKVSWSLRRSSIVLFTLFCIFFRCKLKSDLVSNIIPRWFWVGDDLTKFSLKYNGGWSILLIFLLKITSWACFLGSGLNLIFHWKAQSLIFIKSLFRSLSLYFEQRKTEKCHPQIVLDLRSNHQISHWYKSERIMGQE